MPNARLLTERVRPLGFQSKLLIMLPSKVAARTRSNSSAETARYGIDTLLAGMHSAD